MKTKMDPETFQRKESDLESSKVEIITNYPGIISTKFEAITLIKNEKLSICLTSPLNISNYNHTFWTKIDNKVDIKINKLFYHCSIDEITLYENTRTITQLSCTILEHKSQINHNKLSDAIDAINEQKQIREYQVYIKDELVCLVALNNINNDIIYEYELELYPDDNIDPDIDLIKLDRRKIRDKKKRHEAKHGKPKHGNYIRRKFTKLIQVSKFVYKFLTFEKEYSKAA